MKALEKLRDLIFRDYPPKRQPGVFTADEAGAFVQDWTAYTPPPPAPPRGYYRTCGPAGEVEWVSAPIPKPRRLTRERFEFLMKQRPPDA